MVLFVFPEYITFLMAYFKGYLWHYAYVLPCNHKITHEYNDGSEIQLVLLSSGVQPVKQSELELVSYI